MSWRSNIEELIRSTFRYAFVIKNDKVVLDEEEFYDDTGPWVKMQNEIEALMKSSFQEGHAVGVRDTMSLIPDKDAYDFDKEVDRHASDKKWYEFKSTVLED